MLRRGLIAISVVAIVFALIILVGEKQNPSTKSRHMVHFYSNSASILGAEVNITTRNGQTVSGTFNQTPRKGREGQDVYIDYDYLILQNSPDLRSGYTLTVKHSGHDDVVQVPSGGDRLETVYLFINSEHTIQAGVQKFLL